MQLRLRRISCLPNLQNITGFQCWENVCVEQVCSNNSTSGCLSMLRIRLLERPEMRYIKVQDGQRWYAPFYSRTTMLVAWYVIFLASLHALRNGHADVCSLLEATRNNMANQELQVSQHVNDETKEDGFIPICRGVFTSIGYRSTACSHQLGSKAHDGHMDTPHRQLFRSVEHCTVGQTQPASWSHEVSSIAYFVGS
ncbi:uncharacterized protein P174DRAFT_60619 [Aspergillus novofumigatus IBT 16806]|uniref:Uncharacterized protein n=1 Tax=Aspergillus novofumigatus (strain IBT 16806) TaxID=1392255 RepID=A0A2I1BU59_ASPN1|nr:uncharacterized protein P174DRAFT_60619 [Aspergillus novofumigatus IBT 16806]PKX88937.1 hypothetical protein P174DRAFT_60619 [Aspergillus novofumigatus IBT 16806]